MASVEIYAKNLFNTVFLYVELSTLQFGSKLYRGYNGFK